MGAWTNLAAIAVNASSGDLNSWPTDKQVGSVAGRLGKLIRGILTTQFGLSMGKEGIRNLRIQFLNSTLADIKTWCGNKPITTTSQLAYGEASALLDWLGSDSAADDMWTWLRERVPHAEAMFE